MAVPMRLSREALALITFPLSMLMASSARAQDLLDVQSTVSDTLFTARAIADREERAERRRIEARAQAMAQRTQQQAMILQEQAVTLKNLSGEVQELRDERQLIELASAFDAAIASSRWALARSFLSDVVTVELPNRSEPSAQAVSADAFISDLARSPASGGVLPRSNQRVRIEADRAVLSSNGYAWPAASGRKVPPSQRLGEYEYRFQRTGEGWRIEGLSFRYLGAPNP